MHYLKDDFQSPEGYALRLNNSFGIVGSTMQLEPGQARTRFECFTTADERVRLGRTRIALSELVTFQVPRGYTLISASNDSQPFFCNGYRIDAVQASVYPGGYSYVGAYPRNWHAIDILLKNTLVRERDLLRTDLLRASRSLELRVAELQGSQTAELFAELDKAFSAVEAGENEAREGHNATELLQRELRSAMDQAFPRQEGRNQSRSRRSEIVYAALRHVSHTGTAHLRAEDLAGLVGVQYRSLHYAFKDVLGVSPYRFILIAKLHAARRMLISTRVPVKEICYSQGFDTPSRFRKQYQRLFGELPSASREQLEQG